ncbi:MAG TPA: RT0821/Lpp0805 family surface protein [Rhodospirillales bacterium]|jgi:surface antigen|nr:RT0821/Lpp0805 family surface protein [Rhodospirillales bacterium]
MEKIAIVIIIFFLTACSTEKVNQGAMLGAGLGALAGGFVGYQFGGGLGQALYTTAGVVAGGSVGHVLGERFLSSDIFEFKLTAFKTFVGARDGEIHGWSNSKTGHSGIFRAACTFHARNDHYCRDYSSTVAFMVRMQTTSGTACQLADGTWKVVAQEFG